MDYIVNYQDIGKPSVKNNLYFKTWEVAGLTDVISAKLKLTSPAKKAAVRVPYVISDYYFNNRGSIPSAGAVE